MKNLWLVLLILVPSFAAAETIIEELEGRGAFIETTPSGAKVFIDGIERGSSPLLLHELDAGTHSIEITKDNYETWHKRLSVPQGGRLHLAVELVRITGIVRLRMSDSSSTAALDIKNAQILVNNLPQKYQLDANQLELRLPEGQKTITVRMFGYDEAKKIIVVQKNQPLELEFTLKPASLRFDKVFLSRKRFNPNNNGQLGLVTLNFFVNNAGFVRLKVSSETNTVVYEQLYGQNGGDLPFNDWSQAVTWNGRDTAGNIVSEGRYLLRLELVKDRQGAAAAQEERWVELDYSAEIIPLSLHRLRPGLVNAEHSRILPQNSFQIAATILSGDFAQDDASFSRLPFNAGFRWSPANSIETTLIAQLTPQLGGASAKPGLALGGAVKKEFRQSRRALPGISLGISYSWVDGKNETEAGLNAGASLNSAFSWQLSGKITLLIAPALVWTGTHGYPEEALPRLEAGGGLIWRSAGITAGISARKTAAFVNLAKTEIPVHLSAEITYNPAATNLILSILANSRLDPAPHFSAGFSLGIVY